LSILFVSITHGQANIEVISYLPTFVFRII
jgi:hypothetical protein